MTSVYRTDQLKKFTPFTYSHHSFILSLNVKVCIRFTVFLQISLSFLFVKSYVGWEVCALASHLHVFVSSRRRGGGRGQGKKFKDWGGEGKGVKKFRTWRVTDLRGYFCWGGQYPVTCHVYYHLFIIAITCIIICY